MHYISLMRILHSFLRLDAQRYSASLNPARLSPACLSLICLSPKLSDLQPPFHLIAFATAIIVTTHNDLTKARDQFNHFENILAVGQSRVNSHRLRVIAFSTRSGKTRNAHLRTLFIKGRASFETSSRNFGSRCATSIFRMRVYAYVFIQEYPLTLIINRAFFVRRARGSETRRSKSTSNGKPIRQERFPPSAVLLRVRLPLHRGISPRQIPRRVPALVRLITQSRWVDEIRLNRGGESFAWVATSIFLYQNWEKKAKVSRSA